jgi:hypothetical protein
MVLLHESVNGVKDNVDSLAVQLVGINGILGSINTSLSGVPGKLQELQADVEAVKVAQAKGTSLNPVQEQPKKKGIWPFSLFKKKPKAEAEPEVKPLAAVSLADYVPKPVPTPEPDISESIYNDLSLDLSPTVPTKEPPLPPVGGGSQVTQPITNQLLKPTKLVDGGLLAKAKAKRSAGANPANPVFPESPIGRAPSRTEPKQKAEVWKKGGRHFIREVVDGKTRVHAIKKEEYVKRGGK